MTSHHWGRGSGDGIPLYCHTCTFGIHIWVCTGIRNFSLEYTYHHPRIWTRWLASDDRMYHHGARRPCSRSILPESENSISLCALPCICNFCDTPPRRTLLLTHMTPYRSACCEYPHRLHRGYRQVHRRCKNPTPWIRQWNYTSENSSRKIQLESS